MRDRRNRRADVEHLWTSAGLARLEMPPGDSVWTSDARTHIWALSRSVWPCYASSMHTTQRHTGADDDAIAQLARLLVASVCEASQPPDTADIASVAGGGQTQR